MAASRAAGSTQRRALQPRDGYRTRARAKVYLKDPQFFPQKGPVGEAIVGGDTSIAPGPTSSRFMVVDYDASADRAYAPTPLGPERVESWSQGRGELLIDFAAKAGTRQEAQINAWATAVDTLDLFEQATVLGREVPWAFEGSRLRILPQAMFDANAFYSRHTRALHFGYFRAKKGGTIKTCLSHDIVAHETAHAILDGLRPFYLESLHPDALAFHEYVGDAAAMLSLFRQEGFIAHLAKLPVETRSFFNLVTELAPQVGLGIYGDADRAALRSARNQLTYRDVRNESEPHRRSQVLSGLAFAVFEGLMRRRIDAAKQAEKRERKQGLYAQLLTTARHTLRMLLRPIDLLPPGSISFPEYASTCLRIDLRAHPEDRLGYRKVLEAALRQRGLHPDQQREALQDETEMPANRRLREREIAMIRSSRVGAYRFLDANRKLFGIPRERDFRVVGIGTNRRELDYGTRAVPETIVQYVWEEAVPLPADARTTAIDHVVLRAGGTLAVDENVNLVHWSRQRATTERKDELKARAARLVQDRAIDFEPIRGIVGSRPYLAQRDGAGALRLMANTARMHRGRGAV
jgi:hypothetical protein